jgi:hypothetical protein
VANESPLRSFAVSLGFTAYTLLVVIFTFAAADDAIGTFPAFLAWFGTHWWAMLVSLIVNPAPIYRARQAVLNGRNGNGVSTPRP